MRQCGQVQEGARRDTVTVTAAKGREQVQRAEATYRRAQGSPTAREEGTAERWALLQNRPVQGLAEQRECWRWQAVISRFSCAL